LRTGANVCFFALPICSGGQLQRRATCSRRVLPPAGEEGPRQDVRALVAARRSCRARKSSTPRTNAQRISRGGAPVEQRALTVFLASSLASPVAAACAS